MSFNLGALIHIEQEEGKNTTFLGCRCQLAPPATPAILPVLVSGGQTWSQFQRSKKHVLLFLFLFHEVGG